MREDLQRARRAGDRVDPVGLDADQVASSSPARVPVPANPHQPGDATRKGASTGKHSYSMPVSSFSGPSAPRLATARSAARGGAGSSAASDR